MGTAPRAFFKFPGDFLAVGADLAVKSGVVERVNLPAYCGKVTEHRADRDVFGALVGDVDLPAQLAVR